MLWRHLAEIPRPDGALDGLQERILADALVAAEDERVIDLLVRALQAAGRDLTTESMLKAIQASSSNHPVFYTEEKFDKGHISPEATKVEQVQSGKWTPVSDLLH